MPDVKSTYNFVPATTETEVYIPKWDHQVSHDIPFSDGQSGEITLKITAETPIFIRNGHSKQDADIFEKYKKDQLPNPSPAELDAIQRYLSFSNINGQYFIPATSIKGMLRNVLEIMSFSRMMQVNDDLHAIRQIMGGDEGYTLNDKKDKIKAGYLVKNDGKYYIYPSGEPKKIRYTELDEKFNNQFKNNFETKVSSNFDERTGAFKYEKIIKDKPLEYLFEDLTLEDKQRSWVSQFQSLPYVKFSENNEGVWGRIVCVGQATAYKEKQGRKGEYVFLGKREELIQRKEARIEVSDKILNAFLLLNRDGQKTHELKDWRFWKSRVNEGIPVFYRTSDKDPKLLIDFGLTFMYKELVQHSTKSILDYKNEGLDLAETIFGKASKNDSLRGRVMISHFKAIGYCEQIGVHSFALSSPKSSFYPFYLEQKGNHGKTIKFSTFNGDNPRLRGFKRYPVHFESKNQDTTLINPSQISQFQPLSKGTTFEGKIRYHNLRKAELGALISAITLHGSIDSYHTLGSLKPFGFGRVKINLPEGIEAYKEYLKAFEIEMRLHNSSRWKEIINELITMGRVQKAYEDSLAYMALSDFQKIKNENNFLQKYSELVQAKQPLLLFSTEKEIEDKKNDLTRIKQEKLEYFNSLVTTAKDFKEADKFKEAREVYTKCKRIDEAFDLEKQLFELGNLEKLKIQFDTIIQSDNREFLEHHKIDFIGSKWETLISKKIQDITNEQKNQKINQLQNKKLEIDYSSFSKLKETLNKPFKVKGFTYPEEKKSDIELALSHNYKIEKENKKSEWRKQNEKFDKYPWTDIRKWLGEDRAEALYQKLIIL